MTSVAGLTQRYDAAGNVTVAFSADRGISYKYACDHHNRLTAVIRSGASAMPTIPTACR